MNIEPRDRDGFLAKDRPQDIVLPMPTYADMIHERDLCAECRAEGSPYYNPYTRIEVSKTPEGERK